MVSRLDAAEIHTMKMENINVVGISLISLRRGQSLAVFAMLDIVMSGLALF